MATPRVYADLQSLDDEASATVNPLAPADSNVEMTWQALGGDSQELYVAVLKELKNQPSSPSKSAARSTITPRTMRSCLRARSSASA